MSSVLFFEILGRTFGIKPRSLIEFEEYQEQWKNSMTAGKEIRGISYSFPLCYLRAPPQRMERFVLGNIEDWVSRTARLWSLQADLESCLRVTLQNMGLSR